MEYNEEDFLSLSGIQHFAFCRRQWALIHIEQYWQENLRTVEGRILHENAHDPFFTEKRGNLIVSRDMAVFSRTLGVSGACDIVEFRSSPKGVPISGRDGLYLPVPVEYKRGSPKENECDALQLCAQAMCLEEMLLCEIPEGYLYYGETNHRQKILLDDELRCKVKDTLAEMHALYKRKYTPKVKPGKSCKACSLEEYCMPKLYRNNSVTEYINSRLEDAL